MAFSDITPEILAPAGGIPSLYAAVRSGADAVYIGAKDFNARKGAENFSDDELKTAVRYCRIRGVKVYLTLNISVFDRELICALRLAAKAISFGVDALIVSDIGLASLIKERIPSARIHASTQLSVHSPSALPLLYKAGFSRVVISREMNDREIKNFCNAAKEYGIEVEAFVHGALCMCLSGQCYMSAFFGSRSGNRGLCAAPCRLPFLAEGGTGYDLSLKDLSLQNYVRELCDAGVTSFKIEGRMKRPEYTAAAVYCFKKAVTGNRDEKAEKLLESVFSRSGFTDGYFTGNLGKNMFGTKSEGARDSSVFSEIHNLYRSEISRVPVNVKFYLKQNSPCVLELSDNDNSVTVTGDIPPASHTKEATEKTVGDKLLRFGSTPYFVKEYAAEIDKGLYISPSALGALRNEAVEKLSDLRALVPEVSADLSEIIKGAPRKAERTRFAARFTDATQIPDCVSDFEFIILPADEIKNINTSVPVIAELPRAAADEKIIESLIEKSVNSGVGEFLCGNLAHAEILRKKGLAFTTSFGLNIYNSLSAKYYESLGATRHLLSFEPTAKSQLNLSVSVPRGIIIYGSVPLMITRNCPVKNGTDCKTCGKIRGITDRTGAYFPVRCSYGFSEIFNSVPIVLSDKPEIFDGFDFGVLWFTNEKREETERIVSAYKTHTPPDGPFTRGLTLRGVE